MAKETRGSGLLVLVSVLVLGTLTFMVAGRDYVQSLAGITRCQETVTAAFPSPAGAQTATVYARQCGKGTATVTHVNLHPSTSTPPAAPNGLVRDGEVFLEVGQHAVSARWEGEAALLLEVAGTGALPGAPEKTRGPVQVRIRRAP